MGKRLIGNLDALAEKHSVIGDVRGAGLFCGAEFVKDRTTKEPAEEKWYSLLSLIVWLWAL